MHEGHALSILDRGFLRKIGCTDWNFFCPAGTAKQFRMHHGEWTFIKENGELKMMIK